MDLCVWLGILAYNDNETVKHKHKNYASFIYCNLFIIPDPTNGYQPICMSNTSIRNPNIIMGWESLVEAGIMDAL
jgi:hypothetical protein